MRRPSPAVVISLIALIVALGGTGYAAFRVPDNSIGTAQLRNGAVATKKLRNGAVTAAKINVRTLTVPDALRAGSATIADGAGTLASGHTEQGIWWLSDWSESGSDGASVSSITFPIPLAQAPSAVHYIYLNQPTPSGCSGNVLDPGAAPGNLCVFEGRAYNAGGNRGIEDPTDGGLNQASRFGTGVYLNGTTGPGEADIGGSWAVTAP
jgi:X-X-X-Leu-X-X-Gly heptad repeat protein